MNNKDYFKKVLKAVIDYINYARARYTPEVNNDMLTDNGAVYYMNGNDTTDFDWEANGRCCEIKSFYKTTKKGLYQVFVTIEGYIAGYIYPDEGRSTIKIERKYIGEYEAHEFMFYFLENYDEKDRWDEIITEVNELN
jgi:hypothetical protein